MFLSGSKTKNKAMAKTQNSKKQTKKAPKKKKGAKK